MKNDFTLMHKDKMVARLSIEQDLNGNGCLHIHTLYNNSELPYGVKNELPERLSDSLTWWNNTRSIPTGRPNYDKILKMFNATNSSELLPYTYMCSLTDCYWFKPSDSNLSWDDVNYRKNGFSSNLYKQLFYNDNSEPLNNLDSPDMATDGAIPKMWQQIDGCFCLVKSSLGANPMDVYNEIIANELLNQMDIRHVDYYMDQFGPHASSVCKCFIENENFEFVQAENLISDGYYIDTNDYLEAMKEFGFQNDVDAMILCDMVIGNVDRHSRNYGQIVDSETHKIIGLAPLFDHGGCDMIHDVGKRKYAPTGLTFEETLNSLNKNTLLLAERIDLQSVNQLIDSLPMLEDTKLKVKANINSRVVHIIEIARGIDHDFDREL